MIAPDGAEYLGPPDPLEDFLLVLEGIADDPFSVPYWLGPRRPLSMDACVAELAAHDARRRVAAEAQGAELYERLMAMSPEERDEWVGESAPCARAVEEEAA